MFDNQGNPSYIVKKESNKVIVCQTNNKFSFSLSLNYTTDNFYLSQYDSNTFVIGICNALSSELNIRIVNVYTQRITFENTTTQKCEGSIALAIFGDKKIVSLVQTESGIINETQWSISGSLLKINNANSCYSTHFMVIEPFIQFVEVSTGFGFICVIRTNDSHVLCLSIKSDLNSSPITDIGLICSLDKEQSIVLAKLADNYGIIGCNSNSFKIQILYKICNPDPNVPMNIDVYLNEALVIDQQNLSNYQFSVLSNYKIFIVGIDNSSNINKYYWTIGAFQIDSIETGNPNEDFYFSYYSNTLLYPCYSVCRTCLPNSDESTPNCLTCQPGAYTYEDNSTVCDYFDKKKNGYVLNPLINQYSECVGTFYILNNAFKCDACNSQFPYLIIKTNQCVNSCFVYKLLLFNNDCIEMCPAGTLMINDEKCIYYLNESKEPIVIENTKEEIKENLDDNILHLSETPSIVIGKDFTLQVSSANETKEIEGLSSLYLGECETILKTTYQLSPDSRLIVSHIDTSKETDLTPKVEYKVYDDKGNTLNISVCDSSYGITVSLPILNNETVNMELGIEMGKKGFDVFDIDNDFFVDYCIPFSDSKSDVVLKDRVKDYYQNVSFCEEGCTYGGINYTSNRVKCKCLSSIQSINISDIENSFSFFDTLYSLTNLNLYECSNQVFTIESYTNSIGVYFSGGILFIHLLLIISFFIS